MFCFFACLISACLLAQRHFGRAAVPGLRRYEQMSLALYHRLLVDSSRMFVGISGIASV